MFINNENCWSCKDRKEKTFKIFCKLISIMEFLLSQHIPELCVSNRRFNTSLIIHLSIYDKYKTKQKQKCIFNIRNYVLWCTLSSIFENHSLRWKLQWQTFPVNRKHFQTHNKDIHNVFCIIDYISISSQVISKDILIHNMTYSSKNMIIFSHNCFK